MFAAQPKLMKLSRLILVSCLLLDILRFCVYFVYHSNRPTAVTTPELKKGHVSGLPLNNLTRLSTS